VHEADAVVQAEGGVAETLGLVERELAEDLLDQRLVLVGPIRLRPVP
jgi:hypothetical protein